MAINEQRIALIEFISEQLKQLNSKEIKGLEQTINKYLEKLTVSKAKVAEELKNTFPVEKTVSFIYKNAEGEVSERIIDVKQVMHSEKGWKLKGICHTSFAMKTFNAERIVDDKITDVETNVQDTFKRIFNLS